MAYRKNVKRIDPRYFLNETANRNDDGSALEEVWSPLNPEEQARSAERAERDRSGGDPRIKKFGSGRPPEPSDTSMEALSYWALKVLVARTGLRPGQVQNVKAIDATFPEGIRVSSGEALEDLDNNQLADLVAGGGAGIGPGQRKELNREAEILAARGYLPSGKKMSKE